MAGWRLAGGWLEAAAAAGAGTQIFDGFFEFFAIFD